MKKRGAKYYQGLNIRRGELEEITKKLNRLFNDSVIVAEREITINDLQRDVEESMASLLKRLAEENVPEGEVFVSILDCLELAIEEVWEESEGKHYSMLRGEEYEQNEESDESSPEATMKEIKEDDALKLEKITYEELEIKCRKTHTALCNTLQELRENAPEDLMDKLERDIYLRICSVVDYQAEKERNFCTNHIYTKTKSCALNNYIVSISPILVKVPIDQITFTEKPTENIPGLNPSVGADLEDIITKINEGNDIPENNHKE